VHDHCAYDVVVIGAGVGGLTLALALRDSGLHVALLEKQPNGQSRGWGNDLQPNSLFALASLNLLDEVKALGVVHHHWFAERLGGGLLSRWDYDLLMHPHPYAICIRPHQLSRLLRREAEKVCTVMSAEFLSYSKTGHCHEIVFRSRSGEHTIRTQLIVGADGPSSRLRTAAGIRASLAVYPHRWANAIFERNTDDVTEGHIFFGRGQYLGVVPTQARELVTFHLTTQNSHAEYQVQFGGIEQLQRKYVSMAPILHNCIKNVRSWDQISCPPSIRIRADRWVADGVALVGDAALTVNPVTSQGTCIALVNGVKLATIIRKCFDRGDFSADSLRPYEEWCRPEAEAIQELGDNCLWLFSSRNYVLTWLKNRMLSNLRPNTRLKLRVMAAFCGLHCLLPRRIDWRDGLAAAGFWPQWRR